MVVLFCSDFKFVMATKLVGFWLHADAVYPFYYKQCMQCPGPGETYGVSIDKLTILNQTPEEIKGLSLSKIRELRSMVPFLGWQLWNFERLMSRIHDDVIRYAPSLAALISIIGPLY